MSSGKMILAVLLLTLYFNLSVQEKLKVSIFYETYCPGCHEFILQDLPSTYNKIGSSLILDFVPYGGAKTEKIDGKYIFKCQHGADECKANMGHACELHLNEGQEKDMKYITCTLKTDQPSSLDVMKQCASDANVDFSAIKQCMDSDLGGRLLAKYGDRTHAYPIHFVPFIMYNDHFNETLCDWAINDFLQATCSLFETKPVGCQQQDF